MDSLEAATPIVAYPILSEEAGTATGKVATNAYEAFMNQIGFEKKVEVITPAQEAKMHDVLEKAVGGKLIDIDEILKGRK